MSKNKGFLFIFIPSCTVFLSSACIMVLELVAGRLIARNLGSSLYTWTSVIGIVLAGITVGNYLGGRIADHFPARKALAVLLGISSAACVVTVVLNNLAGEWLWLWKLSWPLHVITYVFLVFMLPSTLLGTISPVVAKMALDQGLPMGKTVGDIYAFGAAGSIAGTFLAGFYLIATMGTIAIIWFIGAVLLAMAVFYWYRLWVLYLWAVIFIALMTMGMVPLKQPDGDATSFALNTAWLLALRERPNPTILYEDESQYFYISIRRVSTVADKRSFMQDKLVHSMLIMGDILDLQYSYARIYAAVTGMLAGDKNKISTLTIGGGGYVFPRYIEKVWPGSRVDVAEIDPRVTEAAVMAFGLDRNSSINTITMDARNYVAELLRKKQTGDHVPRYDFIYEDAINDFSVPYQLTTKEFNDKISQILTDDGVYMVTLIDTYQTGLFLGAILRTVEQTFPYVYVVTEHIRQNIWGTFVVIAAKQRINLDGLTSEKQVANLNLWILNNAEIETLKNRGRRIVLTDDYAPVENLLAPVVHQSALGSLLNKYLERISKLERQGKLDESVATYRELIKASTEPATLIRAYNNMGQILAKQQKWQEAIDAIKGAIECNNKAKVKYSMSDMYFNISMASEKLGKDEDAFEYMNKAIEAYREDLVQEPNSVRTLRNLGRALAEIDRLGEAAEYLQQAVDKGPLEVENHLELVRILSMQKRYDDVIAVLKQAIVSFSGVGDEAVVIELQKQLQSIEDKSKNKE